MMKFVFEAKYVELQAVLNDIYILSPQTIYGYFRCLFTQDPQ